MTAAWPLPHSADYFLERLQALQERIRDHVRTQTAGASLGRLSSVAAQGDGDTTFGIDVWAEEVLHDFFTVWGEELPVLLIAEGNPGDGGITFPPGSDRSAVAFTCIVDPIDGTRGLMYQKRSAWVLAAVAPPPRNSLPRLDEIVVAMQTELPTARSHLSDTLWAVAGGRAEGETVNLLSGERRSFQPRPSTAGTLEYGFAGLVKFFPGIKVEAARIEEEIFAALHAGEEREVQVFDDQYISSGGQLYELAVGHDRFIADLRPLLLPSSRMPSAHRLCAHPYDLCTESIARAAGAVVTDAAGGPLRYSLDIRENCAWAGYANEELHQRIAPLLAQTLARRESGAGGA